MRKIFRALTALLAVTATLGAYSCEHINDRDMMVTPSTIDLEYSIDAPTPIRVSVNAGHDWYAQPTCEWITVTNVTNTGFTLEVAPYVGHGADMRSGIVLVSSQIGQWPVIINQERTPYTTIDEWMGTWRIQCTEYNQSGAYDTASLPTTPTGDIYDYLTSSFYMEENVGGVDCQFIVIKNLIKYEVDTWNAESYLILQYLPESGRVIISDRVYGYSAAIPLYVTSTTLVPMFGLEVTVDPVTKQLNVPAVYNGGDVYWTQFADPWFFGDYVYGGMQITHVDSTPVPAPALNAAIEIGGVDMNANPAASKMK